MGETDLISRADIEWHDYLVADGNGMYHDEKIAYKSQIDMLPSAQPKSRCNTCRYTNLEWYEEPCDSCTMGGESNHYKPSAQPEIIRCKDCKYKFLDDMVWNCPFGLSGGENFFCSYGAKDGDTDE